MDPIQEQIRATTAELVQASLIIQLFMNAREGTSPIEEIHAVFVPALLQAMISVMDSSTDLINQVMETFPDPDHVDDRHTAPSPV